MNKWIMCLALAFTLMNAAAQSTEEKKAYEQMLMSTTPESAEQFYKKYPNSVYREEAFTTWQTRLLQNTKKLNYNEALVQLNRFKTMFPGSPLQNQARNLYELKWGEAQSFSKQKLIEAQNDKKSYVSHKTKRLVKDMWLAPVYFGIGYALGYYAFGEERSTQQGLLMGGIMGGIGIAVPLSSFSARTAPYKREVRRWQTEYDKYSVNPRY